jgi:hypothetical protein
MGNASETLTEGAYGVYCSNEFQQAELTSDKLCGVLFEERSFIRDVGAKTPSGLMREAHVNGSVFQVSRAL